MGRIHSPRIVLNNLTGYWDVANNNSYPGTGTSLYDLTGNGNTGTLISSPTYNTSGYLTFDGVSYASLGNNAQIVADGTVMCWFNASSPGTGFRGLITKQASYGLYLNSGLLSTYDFGNAVERPTNLNLADGAWHFVALTFVGYNGASPSNNATIYHNGVNILTTTIKISTNFNNIELARGGSVGSGATQLLNGSIASAGVYLEKALSDTEIQQNFNAFRGRFGI